MEAETEGLAHAIGARVKHERHARSWTLDQLAEFANVSRRMLVNIEQGVANPSIATLLRLSDALGVGLPALVETPELKPVTVTRQGDGAVLWNGVAGGRGVLVAGTERPDVVELWDWTLQPGESHSSEAHAVNTKELLQVRDGEIVVDVANEPYRLVTGDALSFPGDLTHAYRNPTTRAAQFTLAVFEPAVGAARHADKGDTPPHVRTAR